MKGELIWADMTGKTVIITGGGKAWAELQKHAKEGANLVIIDVRRYAGKAKLS